MKYLKTFEKYKTPQIGDYVAVKKPAMIKYIPPHRGVNEDLIYIAKIIDKYNNCFKVQYDKYFYNNSREWWLTKNEILGFSSDKQELDHFISATKYNL